MILCCWLLRALDEEVNLDVPCAKYELYVVEMHAIAAARSQCLTLIFEDFQIMLSIRGIMARAATVSLYFYRLIP